MNRLSLPPLFYMMRHAHTDWNDQGMLMGQQDIPLNDKGRVRAEKAAELLKNVKIRTIVTSPMLRARETAEIVAKKLNLTPLVLDELKEACFGAWEKTQKNPEQLKAWNRGEITPIGGESKQDFEVRVTGVLSRLMTYDQPVLCLNHARILEFLLAECGHDLAVFKDKSSKGRPLCFKLLPDSSWKIEVLV